MDPVPDPILPETFLGYSRESNPGPLEASANIVSLFHIKFSPINVGYSVYDRFIVIFLFILVTALKLLVSLWFSCILLLLNNSDTKHEIYYTIL